MRKSIFIPLLFWLCSTPIQTLEAQSATSDFTLSGQLKELKTAKEVYEQETIYLSGDLRTYTKNGQEKRVGVFARRLKAEFDSCSVEAKNEMGACIKSRKRGVLWTGTGGVMLAGGLVLTAVAPPLGVALILTGLVPYSLGAVKLYESGNRLNKAVWLRNRDVITQPN